MRLLTLTLRSSPTPLNEQISRIYRCFASFRRRRAIATCITGGVAFLELTWNVNTRKWHPHLHVLVEGTYLDVQVARKHWHDVTRDSFIIDIRRVRDARQAAYYVTKYAAKSVPAHVACNADLLSEVLEALHGRRTFQTFGSWKAAGLSQHTDDATIWDVVGTLEDIVYQAKHGSSEASEILRALRKGSYDVLSDDLGPDPPPDEVSMLSEDDI